MTPVGNFTERFFKLTNDGNATLDPGSAFFSGTHASQFSVQGLSLSNLAAGANREFEIRFSPTSTGVKTATFNLVSDDPDENPYTFVVQGEAVAFPSIKVQGREAGIWNAIEDADLIPDQAVTDFGNVQAGKPGSRLFRIVNDGNAALSVSSITSNNPLFAIPGPPTTVAAGGSVEFVIDFTPDDYGPATAVITVNNNAPGDGDPYTFALTGTGTAPDARFSGKANSGDGFDNIADGETTPKASEGTLFVMTPVGSFTERFFKLTNDGNAPLSLDLPLFTGADGDQFSVEGLSLTNLGAGNNREFRIRFTPTSPGVKTATFRITSSDPDENPYTFVVQGEAVAFPDIRLQGRESGIWNNIDDEDLVPDQAVTQFGKVALGQTGDRLFRVVNDGNAPLNVSSITSNSAAFTIPGPPTTVPAGESRDFAIAFAPTARGAVNAMITVRSDTPGDEDPYTFAVTGTGEGPEILVEWENRGIFTEVPSGSRADARTGTSFGNVPINGGEVARDFRITNHGDTNLRITAREFTGSGASHFSVSDCSRAIHSPTSRRASRGPSRSRSTHRPQLRSSRPSAWTTTMPTKIPTRFRSPAPGWRKRR
ncbi:MAG: choice-of-anchor D domain-containing protein [Verrucomicrobiales bacterium]